MSMRMRIRALCERLEETSQKLGVIAAMIRDRKEDDAYAIKSYSARLSELAEEIAGIRMALAEIVGEQE
jgi:hypothetical protein